MIETPSALLPSEVSALSLFERALEHCRRRSGGDAASILERLSAGDPDVHATLRYALAKGVGEYLGRLGPPFRAVYVYGSAMTESASSCSDIDIIVVVDRDRDEIGRLLRGLDLALVARLRATVPGATRLRSLLDVRVVEAGTSSEDDRHGIPAPALQGRPVCLWRFPSEAQGGLRTGVPHGPGEEINPR
jgi:predicted nucleotidyltransferase